MKSTFACILISAVSLVGAGHASASPLTFTYKGIVTSGADYSGLFGAAGTDLTGDSFEVVETFDPTKATGSYSGWGYNYSYGGSAYGSADFASSMIKIGSSAFLRIEGDGAQNFSENIYNSNYVEGYNQNQSNGVYTEEYNYTSMYGESPSLTVGNQPVNVLFGGNSYAGGSFSSGTYSYDYNTWNFQESTNAYADFNVQSLTIGAVPLPGSAPMFGAALLGLGVVGYGLKRRRAAATA